VREARWLQISDVDAMDFRVEVAPEREAVRVSPVGEIDVATVDGVRERLDELRATGVRRVVLDLGGVTFIDSTGLRLVLEQLAASATDGCQLSIVPGPRRVQRVFEVAGLDSRLPLVGRAIDQDGARCL